MNILQAFWSFQLDVFAWVRSIAPYAYLYLILVNAVAFILDGLDKSYAKKKKWRIPEANLIGIALLFGIGNAFDSIVSLGAFAFLLKKEKINILNV